MRLSGKPAFERVYAAKTRHSDGPLLFYSLPNEAAHARLGLAVSRRVGTAVVRNRIKRLLREAFRLTQHDWPRGYDLVCLVRPHDPLRLAEYQRLLFSAIRSLHLEWERRGRRQNQQTSKATNQQTEKSEGKSG